MVKKCILYFFSYEQMCSCTETNNKHLSYFICHHAKLLLCHHTLYNNRYRHGLKDQIKTFRTTQCVLNKTIGMSYICPSY